MVKKVIALFVIVSVTCIGINTAAQKKSLRTISERSLARINLSSWIQKSLKVSPDSKRVAYAARIGDRVCVVVDGKEGKQYNGIMEGTPLFSPDSNRLAYAARVGNKEFVVVDGKEGKQYDDILYSPPIFSPDSKRMAYMAGLGVKRCVVVDGKEGKQYDAIVRSIVFDSADSLHYLARLGEDIYLVDERTK